MKKDNALGARIRSVRNHFNLRQEEFGERIGLSGNRISEIELDKGGTSSSVMMSISREFPVDPQWLLSGEGTMLKGSAGRIPIIPEEKLSLRLDKLEEQVARYMNMIVESEPGPGEAVTKVPLYSNAVPAGMPDAASNDVEEFLDMPASWTQGKKNVFALRVNGDSMIEAGIMPGDTLLVEARQTAKDRQVVIASINGEVTVKTLCISSSGAISLAPENRKYRPIAITPDSDFRIQGIVLAALRHY
ncbi:MAG: S24 family peptidase [Chlorobiaceae bacterium]